MAAYAGASLWKYKSSLWPILQQNIKVEIGYRSKTRFLHMYQAGEEKLMENVPHLYSISTKKKNLCTIAECNSEAA